MKIKHIFYISCPTKEICKKNNAQNSVTNIQFKLAYNCNYYISFLLGPTSRAWIFEKRRIQPGRGDRGQLEDSLLGPHRRRTPDGGDNWKKLDSYSTLKVIVTVRNITHLF